MSLDHIVTAARPSNGSPAADRMTQDQAISIATPPGWRPSSCRAVGSWNTPSCACPACSGTRDYRIVVMDFRGTYLYSCDPRVWDFKPVAWLTEPGSVKGKLKTTIKNSKQSSEFSFAYVPNTGILTSDIAGRHETKQIWSVPGAPTGTH
jgi:hypothetical protein